MEHKDNEKEPAELLDAKSCLIGGAAVGVFGAAAALATGAVCPLCVVAAPALLGLGAYKHFRKKGGSAGGQGGN